MEVFLQASSDKESLDPTASLFWLLEEPLIHGARLDVRDSSRPGLSQRLVSARAVKLRHIVDAAGPRLHDAETLASRLGLRSNRHTRNILNAWTTKLTTEELEMLQDYAPAEQKLPMKGIRSHRAGVRSKPV
ncbi:hypothetical protein L3Q82_004793 [Scortum barcoo]|uniref:Uncharacterized protein n=1 Tax=Scortum barcoo TaxID=214431 RepID=A0ACB8VH68_9TELE|nr:hypothetical protein L3Q82_004793 [Scortum barcoo]